MRTRRQRSAAFAGAVAMCAALLLSGTAPGQFPADLIAVGSPGPARLQKLGQILTQLSADYLAHIASRGAADAASFQPASGLLRVADGFVLVDLVAAGDAQALRADLRGLGAIGVQVA